MSATDNLGRVVSSEKCVRSLVHFFGSNAETNHGVIDYAVILKGPQIMEFLFAHILVWRKTEDTIRIISETLGLVECQKLEVCALIGFQLQFEIDQTLGVFVQWLNTGVILPDETLELGRSVGQFGRCFRQDFIGIGFVHVVSLGFASFVQLIPLDEGAR